MLLVGVEESIESGRGEVERFGDETGEGDGEAGHLSDIGLVDGAEGWEIGGVGPLVGREEIMVAWRVWRWGLVLG